MNLRVFVQSLTAMYSLCARRANAYVSFKKAQVLAQAHGSFKLCQRYLETDAPTQPASLSETHLVGHGKQPGTNEPSEMVDWLFQASSPVEQSMPKATKIPENPVIVEETKEDVPNSSAASGSNSKSRSILVRVGGEAKRMADYLSIIHEIENRFGKIQDFRIQKVCQNDLSTLLSSHVGLAGPGVGLLHENHQREL